MNTSEFNKTPTSAQLNESMFKKFGTKVNFDKYTREELENYRNLLRTKVNQTEGAAGFNDLLANESYQQDKFMLELLNTRIKEMLGESVLAEKAVSKAQQKAAGAALAAKKSGSSKGLKGASKEMAKMSKKELEKFAGTKQTGLPEKKTEESVEVKGKSKKAEKADKSKKVKKEVTESSLKSDYKLIIEGLQTFLAEDEEGKAKDITAGTDMVNDFTSWMQRVGQYQTKTMIELSDSIRANFGQAASDAFKTAIAPALAEALSSLTQSRETITRAVAVLAGEEGATPMGAELPGTELDVPPAGDTMNAPVGDEFGASDAAVGGEDAAGREMRESRQIARAQQLAEEHSLIFKLSK